MHMVFRGTRRGGGGGESLTGCKGRTIKNCLGSGKFYPHTPQARNNSRFLRNKDMLFRTVFFKRKKPRNKFIKVYFIDYTFSEDKLTRLEQK